MKIQLTLLLLAVFGSATFAQDKLKSVSEFNAMKDDKARSLALFNEVGKVLKHPRCVNCHPVDNVPRQGEEMQLHIPEVKRGPANFGQVGMMCNTCHQSSNVEVVSQSESIKSIPGHPKWHLAPPEMAWFGKSLGEICRQLKDEERSHMSMDELIKHMAEDTLVGWGWAPGEGREPVPGTQKQFGELFKAWADSGAHCPEV